MSKEREALKQALELLAVATYQSPDLQQRRTDVINAGLSALAEQPAQQEPVAWIVEFDDGYVETTTRLVSDWKRGMWESAGKRFTVKPLYTSPQPSKPLTDAQIGAVAADIWGSVLIAPQSYQAFARAIEATHGITGEQK